MDASKQTTGTFVAMQQVFQQAAQSHVAVQQDLETEAYNRSHSCHYSTSMAVADCWHRHLKVLQRKAKEECMLSVKTSCKTHTLSRCVLSTACETAVALQAITVRQVRKQCVQAVVASAWVQHRVDATFTKIHSAILTSTRQLDDEQSQASQRKGSTAALSSRQPAPQAARLRSSRKAAQKDPLMGMLAAAIQKHMGASESHVQAPGLMAAQPESGQFQRSSRVAPASVAKFGDDAGQRRRSSRPGTAIH